MFSVRTWITFVFVELGAVFVGFLGKHPGGTAFEEAPKRRQADDFEPQTEMEGKSASCGETHLSYIIFEKKCRN